MGSTMRAYINIRSSASIFFIWSATFILTHGQNGLNSDTQNLGGSQGKTLEQEAKDGRGLHRSAGQDTAKHQQQSQYDSIHHHSVRHPENELTQHYHHGDAQVQRAKTVKTHKNVHEHHRGSQLPDSPEQTGNGLSGSKHEPSHAHQHGGLSSQPIPLQQAHANDRAPQHQNQHAQHQHPLQQQQPERLKQPTSPQYPTQQQIHQTQQRHHHDDGHSNQHQHAEHSENLRRDNQPEEKHVPPVPLQPPPPADQLQPPIGQSRPSRNQDGAPVSPVLDEDEEIFISDAALDTDDNDEAFDQDDIDKGFDQGDADKSFDQDDIDKVFHTGDIGGDDSDDDVDGMNGNVDDDIDDEEVESGLPELTPEQKKAEELFIAGERLINATYYKEYREAYLNFLESSKLGHQRAKEYVAFGHLFGDYLPQNITKSSEFFEELASLGSPKAQMGLSFMYGAGFHYNSSQAKALIFSTFGALGGDPLAQMALGYRYYAGIGVESTCETALTYYRKVATKVADSVTLAGGPVVQRVRLQEEAENTGTNNSPLLDDDLLQYYHFLADKGDQQAQVVLGTLYYQGGKGVQINHEQAYHYFATAAESGSGHALGYLGKMHSEGSPFVKQSNQTAFEFFKKSSEKNNHIGQAGLGMMYLNGLGVEKDVNKAFRYFSLASDQGSVDGQLQLGIMYFSGNGVRSDYKLAVKYFTMASQNGHVLAFYNLAQMHATGTGVLRNCHTAVELFKNVAERGKWSEMMMDAHRMYHEGDVDTALVKYMFLADLGYEVAQSNVAYLLDSGATGKFNNHETHQRALLQYSRAASQGSTHARLKMGDYHYYGLGTDIDYESAASHYRMASEQQHNAQAMFNLGYMHEKGLGLKQDVHLAKRFYDMAADTSIDAHVPVTMALFKLGLFYGVDVFSKEFEGISGLLALLDPVAYLGPQWDLYLASALAGLLVLIYMMRRMR